jgi:plastocyanin domain-containing protein
MSAFLVNAGGLALMAAIVWWFWLSTPDTASGSKDQSDSGHNH